MPVAAEKNPIVPMNSLTGIPLSSWTFANTSSAICTFCSCAEATLASHTRETHARTAVTGRERLLPLWTDPVRGYPTPPRGQPPLSLPQKCLAFYHSAARPAGDARLACH